MSLGMELTGNVILSTNSVSGDVLTRTTMVSGNVNQALSVKSAEWGNITGTLSNQTDLNTALTDLGNAQSTMQQTLGKIDGVLISEVGEKYPIISIVNNYTDENGIKWLVIHLDDGTIDGMFILLPNYQGMQTINQIVMSAIPTDNSQLTNGSGYITGISSGDVITALGFTPYSNANPNNYTSDSALTTEDINEVCV